MSENSIPEGFKTTELGPLPEEWGVVKLGDVAKFKNGINFTRDQKGKSGILTIDVFNMYSEGIYVNPTNLYRVNKQINDDYLLRNGDILFVRSSLKREGVGWTSLFRETQEQVTFCGFVIRARLKSNNISPEFLTNYLRTNNAREDLIASSGKVAITNINQGMLGRVTVPLPPLPEQQKIAEVLSTVQQSKEKTDAVISATKELKKSMRRHLFTYGHVPAGETESVPLKETEIGLVPEGWEVVRLGDYLDVLRNGITKKQNKDGKGIPVSRIETISTSEINPQKVGYIVGLSDGEIEKYKLIGGDILFSHINSEPYLGNSAIYETEPKILIHGMNLLLFRTKSDLLNSKFLNYLFNYYRQKQTFIGIASRSVNQSSINQGKIKTLQIPLPSLPTQQKIAHILSTVDKKIEAEENKKKALDELFKSLLHNLMTGKVRVNHLEMTQ